MQLIIVHINVLMLHVSKLPVWHLFVVTALVFPILGRQTARRAMRSLQHFDASLIPLVRTLNLVLHAVLHRDDPLVLALLALVFSPLALFHLVRRVARKSMREVVQLLLVSLQLPRDFSLLGFKLLLGEQWQRLCLHLHRLLQL